MAARAGAALDRLRAAPVMSSAMVDVLGMVFTTQGCAGRGPLPQALWRGLRP